MSYQERRGRGQRLVTVTREALMELFKDTDGYTTNVPDDAILESLWHSEQGFGYVVRISSEEWDPLSEGQEIPEFEVEFGEDTQLPPDLDDPEGLDLEVL